MQINIRLILALLGYFIVFAGTLMFIPATIDFFVTQQNSGAATFYICGVLTLFIGSILLFANKNEQLHFRLSIKEGMLLTVLSWIVLVAFAAFPFKVSYLNLSYTDAYFEMMSGITTTGATIIPHLDELSYGFHIWRAMFQWIGGIGIIVTGVIMIPSMQASGMQMFKIEAFETFDSAFDRAKSIAWGMLIIYTVITLLVIFGLLYFANLDFFDSIIHALTSVSTAGFSDRDASIGYFNNPRAEFILILAMISGGIPYILIYYFFFLRRDTIFKDDQIKAYFAIIIVMTIILALWLMFVNGINTFTSFRYSLFTVVSLVTGTGYVTVNYEGLGTFPTMLLFSIMFIGGCGGSTACGIKVYRFQIGYATAKTAMQRMFLKKHSIVPFYNNRVVGSDFIFAVFAYFFLFFIILMTGSVIISGMGFDFVTALSATAACLTNVGPGLNLVGPAQNFSILSDGAKWLLSFIMLIGRLEILGVILLFTKSFWRH